MDSIFKYLPRAVDKRNSVFVKETMGHVRTSGVNIQEWITFGSPSWWPRAAVGTTCFVAAPSSAIMHWRSACSVLWACLETVGEGPLSREGNVGEGWRGEGRKEGRKGNERKEDEGERQNEERDKSVCLHTVWRSDISETHTERSSREWWHTGGGRGTARTRRGSRFTMATNAGHGRCCFISTAYTSQLCVLACFSYP